MKRGILLCLVGILLFQGCSVMIAHQRERKRNEIFSVKVGMPRSELLRILGTPYKTEGANVDFFKVCIPKYSDAVFHSVMDIAFVGFWEALATPYELVSPCEYELEWVVFYDNMNIVYDIFKKGLYGGPNAGQSSQH